MTVRRSSVVIRLRAITVPFNLGQERELEIPRVVEMPCVRAAPLLYVVVDWPGLGGPINHRSLLDYFNTCLVGLNKSILRVFLAEICVWCSRAAECRAYATAESWRWSNFAAPRPARRPLCNRQ
jgi:hypothetical protein